MYVQGCRLDGREKKAGSLADRPWHVAHCQYNLCQTRVTAVAGRLNTQGFTGAQTLQLGAMNETRLVTIYTFLGDLLAHKISPTGPRLR